MGTNSAEYYREYRKRNAERRREIERQYRERNADKVVAKNAPALALAAEAISLAEEYLRVPSGLMAGEPLQLTAEQI